jgi:L-alanine-DL-glutamate epimerase-like enolase superfamily enzyme
VILDEITLRKVRLPLVRPYQLSYRTFTEFEPIIVEARSRDGRIGWGEGHISPGSSSETRDGGWMFCREHAQRVLGKDTGQAKSLVMDSMPASKVAATALITAIEMLEGHPLLEIQSDAALPLLTPFNSSEPPAIADEVERRLGEGFRTFKIKVGKDTRADLARVGTIQKAIAGRATMRLDANRAYGETDACWFAAALDPEGIELFEQPCRAEDWDANAHVARVSTVPIMLDEPICALADVDRAATIPNVKFCKLKLKRFGGLDLLCDALLHVRARGMEPVLGDGLSSEIGCWMANSLRFDSGALVLPRGFVPEIDREVLDAHTTEVERFAPVSVAAGSA